jgi:hypothetical protein
MGIFDRIFANLAAESPDSVMIDSTHLKAHRIVPPVPSPSRALMARALLISRASAPTSAAPASGSRGAFKSPKETADWRGFGRTGNEHTGE